MTDDEARQTLFDHLRSAEHASLGIDPDATAYLDAAERIEAARAAYRAELELDDVQLMSDASLEEEYLVVGVGAELL